MSSLRDLRAAWTARPPDYSRPVWALVLALDRLPWPWGEEILTGCFVARAFVRAKRLRQALDWVSAHPGTGRGRWRRVRSLCASHGRFVARSAFIGIRDPEAVRRLVAVRGEEHLAAAPRGIIFIGFHLGPANSYVALRASGHHLTWAGNRGASGGWSRDLRKSFQSSEEMRFFSERRRPRRRNEPRRTNKSWLRRLYQARRILLDGGNVFISADGLSGRFAFTVSLAGRRVRIQEGWWALRRETGATVLPVLSHMEGRMQITTIHPALPPLVADPRVDLDACHRALSSVLDAYVREFPEQCYSLAFPRSVTKRDPEPSSHAPVSS